MRPWTLVRRTVPFAVVSAVAVASLVSTSDAAPPAVVTAEAKPAEVTETVVPPVDPTEDEARPDQRTAPSTPEAEEPQPAAELTRSTETFSLLGVTWDAGSTDEDPTVEVRWRSLTDGWSDWTTLETSPTDPASTDVRPGTDPLWVGESDGVDVRVSTPSGRSPSGVRVSTVTDGENGSATVPTAAAVGQPKIISRASWGAKSGSSCSAPVYGASMLGTTLHHTAGSNSYTKAQSAGIVRSTQAYHTGSQGWCDIGYNFLVDKYGQIFEGRKGGITKMVRGAHAGVNAANERTVGVSMMGNYDVAQVPAAMKTAVADLIAWRHSLAGLKATGTYSLGGKTVNRIMGHRDVKSTACPGRYGYAWLTQSGGLRSEVAKRLAGTSTSTPTPSTPAPGTEIQKLAAKIGSTKLGKVVRAEWGNSTQRRAIYANMDLLWTKAAGAYAVSGPAKTEFYRTGEHNGSLGFPTGDPVATSVTGTKVQRFQKGAVYLVTSGSSTAGYALYGPLYKEYQAQKESAGKLGVPRSTVYRARTGYQRLKLTKGYLELSEASGDVSTWYAGGIGPDGLTVPSSRTVTFRGHGFGHGIGMSQYGAQGAARSGKTFKEILAAYYPGTTLSERTGSIRVLLGAATSSTVTVTARSGLAYRNMVSGKRIVLPATRNGKTVSQWRIIPLTADPRKSVLQYRTGSTWTAYDRNFWTGDAQFEATKVALVMPGGSVREYRTSVRSAVPSKGATTRKTVNVTSIDNYTLGVVAAEMPSSWEPEALKAQSVAARTYGVRSLTPSRYYDVCDTTSCQVYKGVAGQTATTDKVVLATLGAILTYQGAPAFTQYSSSSGGASAPGSQPYLKGRLDAWDDWSGNANHDWTASVPAATIEKAYPQVGTLRSLKVTKRDLMGDWAGRVESITLTGTKGSTTVTGPQLRFALGLRSHYFRLG